MTDRTLADFYLGEVVDWLDHGRLHPEVTIIGPCHWTQWISLDDPRRRGWGWCYSVAYADGDQGIELKSNLQRKRIPPNPDAVSTPREVDECV